MSTGAVFGPGVGRSAHVGSMSACALPEPAVRVYDTCKPVGCGRLSGRRMLVRRGGEPGLTEQLIGQLGYLGITLILILGGLGLPIPEEAPIILAAVLSRNGQMSVPLALASCLAGVLLGDLVVYFLGFFYGEKVLSLPLTRRLLDPTAGSADQGVLSPARLQDPRVRPVRPRLSHGRLPDRRDSQAADLEVDHDRRCGGIADHILDVRAGILRLPTRFKAASARCSSGSP